MEFFIAITLFLDLKNNTRQVLLQIKQICRVLSQVGPVDATISHFFVIEIVKLNKY